MGQETPGTPLGPSIPPAGRGDGGLLAWARLPSLQRSQAWRHVAATPSSELFNLNHLFWGQGGRGHATVLSIEPSAWSDGVRELEAAWALAVRASRAWSRLELASCLLRI